MTKRKFLECLSVFKSSFPRSKAAFADKASVEVWFGALKDISDDDFNATTEFIVMNHKFFPSIAEIREIARKMSNGVNRSSEDAWCEFIKAIRKYGRNNQPKFDDPVLNRTANAIGWREVCNSEESKLSISRSQFLKMYNSFVGQNIELEKLNEVSEKRGKTIQIGGTVNCVLNQIKNNKINSLS